MTPDEEIVRAGHAKEIFDSPLFNEVRQHVIDGLNRQMAKCSINDTGMHTRLIITLQLWNQIDNYLKQVMDSGRLAEFQVQEKEKRFRMFG